MWRAIAILDPILHKAGTLSTQELTIMRGRAQLGFYAIQQTETFRQVADIVLNDRNWYGGSGYPLGLTAHDIPFGSRVIAMLGAYDVMTTGRPYRRVRTIREAAEELILGKAARSTRKWWMRHWKPSSSEFTEEGHCLRVHRPSAGPDFRH